MIQLFVVFSPYMYKVAMILFVIPFDLSYHTLGTSIHCLSSYLKMLLLLNAPLVNIMVLNPKLTLLIYGIIDNGTGKLRAKSDFLLHYKTQAVTIEAIT